MHVYETKIQLIVDIKQVLTQSFPNCYPKDIAASFSNIFNFNYEHSNFSKLIVAITDNKQGPTLKIGIDRREDCFRQVQLGMIFSEVQSLQLKK